MKVAINVGKKVFKRKINQTKKAKKRTVEEKREEKAETEPTMQKEDISSKKSSILTNVEFESLRGKISDNTLTAINSMGFKKMTEIQANSIQPLLEVFLIIDSLILSGPPYSSMPTFVDFS